MAAASCSTTKTSHRKRSHKSSHYDRHAGTKRKKDGHTSKEDQKLNRFKTLAQLAKLVQSGKLNMPCSLVEYVDDHASLIDQIFTILTIDDIEGMLPDILKGLKLKKIKHLCYLQLSNMSAVDLRRVITEEPTDQSSSATSGAEEAALINEISNEEMEEETKSPSTHVGVAIEDEIELSVRSDELLTCNKDFNGSRSSSQMKNEMYDTRRHKVKREKADRQGQENEKWSDVTDIEEEAENKGDDNSPMTKDKRWKEGIPEDAKLMEMRLREKMLEAQVRRLTEREAQRIKKEEMEVVSNQLGSNDEETDEGTDEEVANPEPGELVELDLRQRALESLVAKRRQKLSNS